MRPTKRARHSTRKRIRTDKRAALYRSAIPKEKRLWRVPDERGMYETLRSLGWGWDSQLKQEIAPQSKGLSKKLGIERGSQILFFAGCFGDWANALARDGIRVVYSDASPDMVRGIKESEKGKKFESARVFEASQWPRKPNDYDWSVSFEPLPIVDSGLTLGLMRSLLNRKGGKVVYGENSQGAISLTLEAMKKISKLYGATHGKKEVMVRDVRGWKEKVIVLTLKTNENARRKAWIDIQVLKAVRSGRKLREERELTLEELLKSERIKRLRISKEELVESLNRLEVLASLIYRYRKTSQITS